MSDRTRGEMAAFNTQSSDAQWAARGDYAAPSASASSQQRMTLKAEDEKLASGARVLVVHNVDGKDSVKGKGRRRGRFIILVDEGEEPRRWPWILLALCIIFLVGIATYFILRTAGRNNEPPTEPNSNLQNLGFNGDVETFERCGGGDRALIARLRDTAKETTIQYSQAVQSQWDQNETVWYDILVPTLTDATTADFGGDPEMWSPSKYAYAVSGTELIVLSSSQNSTRVIKRLEFSRLPAFQSGKQLTLMSETASPVLVDTGLATFTANQILRPADRNDVLVVIGSAMGAAPENQGRTPNIFVGERRSRSPIYTHPSFRPFDTTVVIVLDTSQPEQPSVHSVTEYEGQFVTAEEQDDWAWVFMRASAHVSADHESKDDRTLDDSIMPLFRYITVNDSSELQAWQKVGSCEDVFHLDLDSEREQSYMLVAQPIFIDLLNGGGLVEDVPLASSGAGSTVNGPKLFVLGWSTQMQPVLLAKAEASGGSLQLFLAETLTGSNQPGATVKRTPASAAGTAPQEISATQTALIKFKLIGSNMNFSGFEDLQYFEGSAEFTGSMHYLPQAQQLSLLLTESLDDSESLSTSYYLYNTTEELEQVFNRTEQFRDRRPTSIAYISHDENFADAFVGFASAPEPLVQALPKVQAGNTDCDPASSECARSVQRLFVREQVSLMKGFSQEVESATDSDPQYANFLLVAGRDISESNSGSAAIASPPEPEGVPTGASSGKLQFSLYSYLLGENRMERQTTMTVAHGEVLSEAFRDERAAWLFHAPSSSMEGTDLFFALPVSILKESKQLLEQLGCAGAQGFSGVFIWRIKASAVKDGETVTTSASVTRVAAVPSTGECGLGATSSFEESMVKRMRFFGQDQDLHLVAFSNCHMLSVPWSQVIEAIPEDLPPTAVAKAMNSTLKDATTNSGGVFTKLSGTAQQFSGAAHCQQQ